MKQIRYIDEETHKTIKMYAVENNLTMPQAVAKLIQLGLKMAQTEQA